MLYEWPSWVPWVSWLASLGSLFRYSASKRPFSQLHFQVRHFSVHFAFGCTTTFRSFGVSGTCSLRSFREFQAPSLSRVSSLLRYNHFLWYLYFYVTSYLTSTASRPLYAHISTHMGRTGCSEEDARTTSPTGKDLNSTNPTDGFAVRSGLGRG